MATYIVHSKRDAVKIAERLIYTREPNFSFGVAMNGSLQLTTGLPVHDPKAWIDFVNWLEGEGIHIRDRGF